MQMSFLFLLVRICKQEWNGQKKKISTNRRFHIVILLSPFEIPINSHYVFYALGKKAFLRISKRA